MGILVRLQLIYRFIFILILIFGCFELGCVSTDNIVYTNPNYPNIEIIKFLTSNPYPYLPGEKLSVDVVINSTKPEYGARMPDGSINYTGKSVSIPISAYVEGIGNKTEYVNLSYNETKTVSISFDYNKSSIGYHKIIVTTPSMEKEMIVTIFDGRI